jgi:CPA2 family monovalent cation:H+ antiporter-2
MTPAHGPLILTVVAGLVLAFGLGALAHRLRISPLVGYLLAGVVVGPFTPGYVANQGLANDLAEIGIILLMFGVGLHFSLRELLSVKAIAIPGALAQILIATLLGVGLGWLLDWPLSGGIVFGLSLSVASTVVLLRALQERRLVETERGRIAVGWLIVEDLATVVALVLLPALAAAGNHAGGRLILALVLTLAKAGTFIAIMLVVGRRVVPAVLHYVAHTGSRELFRLAVLAVALGTAYGAATLFGVSFALGAFFAGMILSESRLSQRAAEEAMPLRDAFAVLFFVSVGMLFDPRILMEHPWSLLATLGIILFGKSAAAFLLVRTFRHPQATALTIAASLAQIGEFSFILAALGVSLGILPEDGRDLILAGAIVTILLNPFLFAWAERRGARSQHKIEDAAATPAQPPEPETDLVPTTLRGHTILIGFGRVGRLVGRRLQEAGTPMLVVEAYPESVERARAEGMEVIAGNGADARMLEAANVAGASTLLVAIPEAFEAGQIAEQARAANPGIAIIARAHSDEEVEHLLRHGVDTTIMGEREIAYRMLDHALPAERGYGRESRASDDPGLGGAALSA